MRPFEGIIFDLGNTLIYFEGSWLEVRPQAAEALYSSLKASGLDLQREEFIDYFLASLNDYHQEREIQLLELTTFRMLQQVLIKLGYPDVSDEFVRSALEAMYAVTQAHWIPEEDALPTLRLLKKSGYRLAMVSNAGDDADVQFLIDKAGLRSYFEIILTSAEQGIRKPDPRLFHAVLDYWGYTPAQVAMVGDTLNADILGALDAGIYSIWITGRADTPANRDNVDTIQPAASIPTLSELPALLSSLGE
jgi:HAD superfamily hydrolase (TIGR01509 family)